MAEQVKSLKINLTKYLDEVHGLKVLGSSEDGRLRATDRKGKILFINPTEFVAGDKGINESAAHRGLSLKDVKVSLNAPSNALKDSPVGVLDRLLLMAGNEKGQVSFLKGQFDGVRFDEDKGVVVKDKDGLWKTVDPNQFAGSDPWKTSKFLKETIIDTAEFAAGSGLQIAGAIGGVVLAAPFAAVTGPVAFAAGAGAGGGAGDFVRTSLGRIVGTFEGTLEDQFISAGWETAFAVTGQTLAAGVRPVKNLIKKWITGFSKKASENSKAVVSEVMGGMNNSGSRATRRVIEKTDDVFKEIDNLKSSGISFEDAEELGNNLQIKDVKAILEDGIEALPRKYGELLEDLLTKSEAKNVSVNVGKIASDAKNEFVEQGFGKIDKAGKFVQLTEDELALRSMKGLPAGGNAILPDQFSTVKLIHDKLNAFSKFQKPLKGRHAARVLVDINRNINLLSKPIRESKNEGAKRALNLSSAEFRNKTGAELEKSGLKSEYLKMSALYEKFKKPVDEVRKLVDEESEDKILRQFFSNTSAKGKASRTLNKIIELGGKTSTDRFEKVLTRDAAMKYMRIMPAGLQKQVASVAALTAAGGAAVGSPAALALLPLAAQTSPRFVGIEIKLANDTLKLFTMANDFLSSLSESQLGRAVQSDTFLRNVFGQTLKALSEKEQTEGLLKDGALQTFSEATQPPPPQPPQQQGQDVREQTPRQSPNQ